MLMLFAMLYGEGKPAKRYNDPIYNYGVSSSSLRGGLCPAAGCIKAVMMMKIKREPSDDAENRHCCTVVIYSADLSETLRVCYTK